MSGGTKLIRIDISKGLHIRAAASILLEEADNLRALVGAEFNGVDIVASPGDTIETIIKNWDRAFEEVRDRYRNSPEGRMWKRNELEFFIARAQEQIEKIDSGEWLP